MDPSLLTVIKTEPAVLGPVDLCKYTYKWHNQTYSVILNTKLTSFDSFASNLLTRKIPFIVNRGLWSKLIDIDRWNLFIGPFGDFHRSIKGIYIPFCINYFSSSNGRDHTRYYIYDTYGNVIEFCNTDYTYYMKWKNSLSDMNDLKNRNTSMNIQHNENTTDETKTEH